MSVIDRNINVLERKSKGDNKLNPDDSKFLRKLTDAKKLNEATKPKVETYHKTFSSAVQAARSDAESRGYVVDDDDWFREVNTGTGKPKEGATTRMTIGLSKDGKEQKKSLHIQVYGMKNNYELNHYIS